MPTLDEMLTLAWLKGWWEGHPDSVAYRCMPQDCAIAVPIAVETGCNACFSPGRGVLHVVTEWGELERAYAPEPVTALAKRFDNPPVMGIGLVRAPEIVTLIEEIEGERAE